MSDLLRGGWVLPDIVMSDLLSPHILNRPGIHPASPHPQSLDVDLTDESPSASSSSLSILSSSSTSTSSTVVVEAEKDIKDENQGKRQQPKAFHLDNSQGFGPPGNPQGYEKSIEKVRYYFTYPTEGTLLMLAYVICPCCLSDQELSPLSNHLQDIPCVTLSLKQNKSPRLEFEKHLPAQPMNPQEVGRGERISFLYYSTATPNTLTSVSGIKIPWIQLKKRSQPKGNGKRALGVLS